MGSRLQAASWVRGYERRQIFDALTILTGDVAETYALDRTTPVATRLAVIASRVNRALGGAGWWVGAYIGDTAQGIDADEDTGIDQWQRKLAEGDGTEVVRCFDHDLVEWGVAIDASGSDVEAYEIAPVVRALMFCAVSAARSPHPVD